MTALERKLCSDCGEENLENESRCWACGGDSFAPLGSPPAGERTVRLPHHGERTLQWDGPAAPVSSSVAWACVAATLTVLACIGAFFLGRTTMASAPPREPAVSGPISLPDAPKGPGLPSGTFPTRPVGPADTGADNPQVSVRSLPGQPAAPPPSSPGTPPPNMVFSPPTAPAPAPPAAQGGSSRPAVGLPPPAQVPIPNPTPTTSVVALRNGSNVLSAVSFEGPEQRSVTVAPGATIPLELPPGRYQVRIGPRRFTMELEPNNSYSVQVDAGGGQGVTLTQPLGSAG